VKKNSYNVKLRLSKFRLRLELPLFLLLALAIHTSRRNIYDAFRLLQVNKMMCRLLTEHCKVARLVEQLTLRTKDVRKSLSIVSSLVEDPLATYLRGYIYTLYTIGSTLDYNEKWIANSIENLEIAIKEKLNFTATFVEALIIVATLLALSFTLLGTINNNVMVLLIPVFLSLMLVLAYRIRIGLLELQTSSKSRFIATLVESLILLTASYLFLAKSANAVAMFLASSALIMSTGYVYFYLNKIVELQALGDLMYKFSEQARILGHIRLFEAKDLLVDKKFSKLFKYIAYAVKTGRLLEEGGKASIMATFTAYIFANMMRSGTYVVRVLDKMAEFFKKLYELERYIIMRFIIYELVMIVGGLINGLTIKALTSLGTTLSGVDTILQFFANINVVVVYAVLLAALWLGSYTIAMMLLDVPISIATPLTLLVYTILLETTNSSKFNLFLPL